jgi:hypothetical protein
MARSSECTEQHAQKVIDSAGIVREAILRKLSDVTFIALLATSCRLVAIRCLTR